MLGKVLRFDDFFGCYKTMMIYLSVALAACIVKFLRPDEGWFDLVIKVRRLSHRTA